MEKVYLIKKIPEANKATTEYPRIRTTAEVFNEVAKLSSELNQPMSKVTSKLILFALEHVEIIEDKGEDE